MKAEFILSFISAFFLNVVFFSCTQDELLPGLKGSLDGSLHDYEMDQNFNQLKEGTIYLRLYPIAMGQGYAINDYFPEALGPPSNVASFNWNELAGETGNQ